MDLSLRVRGEGPLPRLRFLAAFPPSANPAQLILDIDCRRVSGGEELGRALRRKPETGEAEERKTSTCHLASDKVLSLIFDPERSCELFTRRGFFSDGVRRSTSLFLRHRIPPRQGVFLHAAGVQRLPGGACFLFLGPAGAGKTTLSRRAARMGFRVLSDDTVYVLEKRGSFHAVGTPFGRISDGPIDARIGGIFFLEKAEQNRSGSLRLASAAVRLWGDSFYNDRSFSSAERRDAFLAQLELLETIPTRLLAFRKDFQEWDLLERSIRGPA